MLSKLRSLLLLFLSNTCSLSGSGFVSNPPSLQNNCLITLNASLLSKCFRPYYLSTNLKSKT